MAAIIVQPKWQTPEQSITPESTFCARRNFIKTLGLCGLGFIAGVPSAAALLKTRQRSERKKIRPVRICIRLAGILISFSTDPLLTKPMRHRTIIFMSSVCSKEPFTRKLRD